MNTENVDKTAGPAFPILLPDGTAWGGMSLRDWFAGMALMGIYAHTGGRVDPKIDARYAYDTADAMLQEGRK